MEKKLFLAFSSFPAKSDESLFTHSRESASSQLTGMKANSRSSQGCQMVYFQTKNPTLGKFLRALDWKMLKYLMAIRNILRTLGKFRDHFDHFVLFGTFFPVWVSRTNKNLATLVPATFCKRSQWPNSEHNQCFTAHGCQIFLGITYQP
jgi:hypothetical protein